MMLDLIGVRVESLFRLHTVSQRPHATHFRGSKPSLKTVTGCLDHVLRYVGGDAVAVDAPEGDRLLRLDDELRLDGLVLVRYAPRVRALHDAHDLLGHLDHELLGHVEVPDDVDGRVGGDERDLVELLRVQLPVLDLDYVLPAGLLARHMHQDAHCGVDVLLDAYDPEDLQGRADLDVVYHGAVPDGRDLELLHSTAPRTIARRAIRTGT